MKICISLLFFLTICFQQALAIRIKTPPTPAAFYVNDYLHKLKNKRVALLVNPTSMVGRTHLVDTLLKLGVTIKKIFGPEHGFRGTADAGEKITNAIDSKTGIPVISLYGKHDKPTKEDLNNIDVVIFDIQDVGVRFYTYISTLQYMMEACAVYKKNLIVLDRPNPNGYYVDGPVLESVNTSFVGMQRIPIVHGMTVGEYARMLNGEKWLKNKLQCKLTVIPCRSYSHYDSYTIPIPPSPNLKTQASILLYPSLCLFEGTIISVGRGTDRPFEMWGHPDLKENTFTFTPQPNTGAKEPLYKNQKCYGQDMGSDVYTIREQLNNHITLEPLIKAYQQTQDKTKFFNSFFIKLAGTAQLQQQIESGMNEESIRASWQKDLSAFKKIRKKYLLYQDFLEEDGNQ